MKKGIFSFLFCTAFLFPQVGHSRLYCEAFIYRNESQLEHRLIAQFPMQQYRINKNYISEKWFQYKLKILHHHAHLYFQVKDCLDDSGFVEVHGKVGQPLLIWENKILFEVLCKERELRFP